MNCLLLFPSDFIPGQNNTARISGRRKEHLQSVFNAQTGREIKVGIVNGKMGTGIVVGQSENEILLDITVFTNPPAPAPLTLILALPRPKSLKKSIEVATSLGIKKIYIIESWRVEKSYWTSPVLSSEKLIEHILLGLEQARDTVIPQIEIRKRFKPFVEDEIPEIIQGTEAIVAHPYAKQPCPYRINTSCTLAIGPEGGFIPYEIEMFEKCGFKSYTFGDRILRVEYAIPALAGRIL
jgi:RsmE family RNA methyltransferase